MFLLTSFHMNNEQLFWYIRIEKMLDAYDMISNNHLLNRQEILSSLENKDNDFYIQTYFYVSNEYKKALSKITPALSFLIKNKEILFMATVKINEKLVSIIKDKRKKKKLTQKDMAEYLQISFSNYQRLEANKYETYDQNLLKQIAVKLEIDDEIFSDTLKVSPTTKMALRIKNETLKQIKMIEIEHEFDSFSQTANYIFEQYFLNHDLSKVKYDIENMFQEVVLKTWATTVKDLEKENISNKKFLDFILETYEIDEEQAKKDFNSIESKRKNIAKW